MDGGVIKGDRNSAEDFIKWGGTRKRHSTNIISNPLNPFTKCVHLVLDMYLLKRQNSVWNWGLNVSLILATFLLFCELLFGQQTSLTKKPTCKSALSFSPGVCLVLSYVSHCMRRHAPTHFLFPLTHSSLHSIISPKGTLLFHKMLGTSLILYCSVHATLSH